MLGAFHERTAGGRTVALRDLSGAHESAPRARRGRGSTRSATSPASPTGWPTAPPGVRERGRLRPRPRQGPAGVARREVHLPAAGRRQSHPLVPLRQRRRACEWKVNAAGQPGLGLDATVAAFQAALDAWTADPGTNINYVYAGTTRPRAGLTRSDGVNAILFDDPFRDDPDQAVEGTFDCSSGGVIAMGGPFFYYPETTAYKGKRYHEAVEADIVTNDGTECLFQNNPTPPRRSSPTSSATPWASPTRRTRRPSCSPASTTTAAAPGWQPTTAPPSA